MDLVEFEDGVTNDGTALFKTVEAFRVAFFFSTSVELKTKSAGRGGADREMMDSNTSLPSILTPKHFFGCFCDLFWQIGFCLYLSFRQVFGTQLWLSDLYDHHCYQGNNLFGGEIKYVVGGVVVKLVLQWRHKKFDFGPHVAWKLDPCTQDSLGNWRHEAPYSLHILGFFYLCLDNFCANELHHTQHTSVF